MKIAIVCMTPPDCKGGVTKVSLALFKGLLERGHDVFLITTGGADSLPSPLRERTMEVGRIPSASSYFRDLIFSNRVAALLKKQKFDVIQGWSGQMLYVCRSVNVPCVIYLGSAPARIKKVLDEETKKLIRYSLSYFIRWKIDNFLFDLFDYRMAEYYHASKVFVPSTIVKEELIEYYRVPEFKIEVVPHGVEEPLPKQDEEENVNNSGKCDEKGEIVLFCGFNTPRKGLEYLLRAFRIVLKNTKFRESVKLVIIGTPHPYYSQYYVDLVKSLGIEKNVVFKGEVDDETLIKYYIHCKLLVLPSLEDGFGIPVVEALAFGKPVIVSSYTGAKDVVIESGAGIIVPPRDISALANATISLLRDEKMRRTMGERGHLVVKRKYTWNHIVSKVERIYEEIIDEVKRR